MTTAAFFAIENKPKMDQPKISATPTDYLVEEDRISPKVGTENYVSASHG